MDKKIQLIIGMVDKATAPLKEILAGTERLVQGFGKTRGELKRLGALTSDVEKFKKLKKLVPQTAEALEAAKRKAAALSLEFKSAEKPTKKLTEELARAKKAVNRLKDAHSKEQVELQGMRNKLNQAGVNTRDLSQATRKLREETARYNRELENNEQKLKRISAAQEKMSKRMAKAGKVGMGAAAVGGVAYGINRGINYALDPLREVERAKGELASVGVTDLDLIVAKGRAVAGKLAGVTTATFVAAAYDIKSGISSLSDEGVAAMTEAASITAKATKSLPEEMTSLFATGYGIYKKQFSNTSDAEFGGLFSASLAKAVQQFKTTGPELQQSIEGLGAGATNIGMSLPDQLSALGMLKQQMQAGEAGTALSSFATGAAKAHESFSELANVGDNPALVRILDQNGMLRRLPDILADMKERYGETLDAFESAEIKNAFGRGEAKKVIDGLWGQEAAFRANAAALKDAGAEGLGFTTSMAKLLDNNLDSRLIILGQTVGKLREKLGERLIPVIDWLIPKVKAVVESVSGWIDRNPRLAATVGSVVVVVGALASAIAPAMALLAGLIGSYAVLSLATTKAGISLTGLNSLFGIAKVQAVALGVAQKAAAVGTWALNLALSANPIGIVLAGVAALAAGAYLVIKNWEKVKSFFAGVWEFVKKIFEYTPIGLIAKLIGGGDSTSGGSAQESVVPSSPVFSSPAAVAAGGGGGMNVHITINPSPGMDERDIAEKVRVVLRQEEDRRKAARRGGLHD